MAEVVDATDLKSVDLGRTGSSPVARTNLPFFAKRKFLIQWIKNREDLCFNVLIARTGCASAMDRAQGCSHKTCTDPVDRF